MKKIGKLLKNKKGFTLIELIVVIAVLGMIAAIAVPKFTGVVDKTAAQADASSIKVLEGAVDRFYAEKGVYPDPDVAADITTLEGYVKAFPVQQKATDKGAPFYLHDDGVVNATAASGTALQ